MGHGLIKECLQSTRTFFWITMLQLKNIRANMCVRVCNVCPRLERLCPRALLLATFFYIALRLLPVVLSDFLYLRVPRTFVRLLVLEASADVRFSPQNPGELLSSCASVVSFTHGRCGEFWSEESIPLLVTSLQHPLFTIGPTPLPSLVRWHSA